MNTAGSNATTTTTTNSTRGMTFAAVTIALMIAASRMPRMMST